MQTSVIGFPRIGTLRELKFASEKYFRGEISSQELLDTAKNLRKIHWTTQKNEGIDFIPSNDFSFYDTLLDTAADLELFQEDIRSLIYQVLIHILQWQEAIRESLVMLRHWQ